MKQPLLGLLCALTAPSWAEEADKPTIAPVTNAAFHSVVFQNDNMSLLSVTLPPGTSTGRMIRIWFLPSRLAQR